MILRYDGNNKFKILQLTDIHIGSSPFHQDDLKSFQLLKKVISEVRPNLIVLTGDIIWTEGVNNPKAAYDAVVEILNHYSIPIMVCYGNHDSEDNIRRQDLWAWEKAIKHNVNKVNEKVFKKIARRDFNIEIFDHKNNVSTVLYGIDSGGGSDVQFSQYDWVSYEQIEHFSNVNLEYASRGIKGLVFQHIPIPEYEQATKVIEQGVFKDDDGVGAPTVNTGFFSHMLTAGNILGVFVGHDHDNNFCGCVHGIQLCYGNVSGYQAYGKLPRGGRVIELECNQGDVLMHTYIVSMLEKS